jgi:hypothetical protein
MPALLFSSEVEEEGFRPPPCHITAVAYVRRTEQRIPQTAYFCEGGIERYVSLGSQNSPT